jgi:hypothetical protein
MVAFTDIGNSLAHVQHLLKDLASFETKSSVRVGCKQRGAVVTVSPGSSEGTGTSQAGHRDPMVPTSALGTGSAVCSPFVTNHELAIDFPLGQVTQHYPKHQNGFQDQVVLSQL